MTRTPYAADVLLDEVAALYPKAKMTPVGEPDGLDVHREFRFDKATSSQIAEAVEFLSDNRLHSVNVTRDGYLHVCFRAESAYADRRDPFMLKIALDVLRDPKT